MKPINEQDMEDLKGMLAVKAADSAKKNHRIEAVASMLQCDVTEARAHLYRGRRLARSLEAERVG